MSVSGRKGREGEQGPIIYITEGWYPNAKENGMGPARGRSEGAKDRGDIYNIPYTMIESKNYSNPPVGSLLQNAEWKAENAQMPVWWLTYKRKGFSKNRAGEWHALTTVEGFINGFQPRYWNPEDGHLTLDDVQDFTSRNEDVELHIDARYPASKVVERPWKIYACFRSFYSPIESKRELEFIHADLDPTDGDDSRYVTLVIHPRRDLPVEKWYVYTRISHMCRMLETTGILNQEDNQYDQV